MPLVSISTEPLNITPKLLQKLVTEVPYSAWTLVCFGILFMRIVAEGSLERTRQTTVGGILADSHASVVMYIGLLSKNPTRNV